MNAWRSMLCAALVVCGRAHALGADLGYDNFTTPDTVTWVQLCGTWADGDRQGRYRVVHAERYAQSFVYVQRMTRDADGTLQAVSTTAIAELDNDHADISLSELTCRATPRGIVVSGRAASGHDDRLRRITIEVGLEAGPYGYRYRALNR